VEFHGNLPSKLLEIKLCYEVNIVEITEVGSTCKLCRKCR